MNKVTLKALIGSIQKWHNIAYYDGIDEGPKNCPLCELFLDYFNFSSTTCGECPVKDEMQQPYCENTPYGDFLFSGTAASAIKELEFLVTLLPLGEEAVMDDGWIWYRKS